MSRPPCGPGRCTYLGHNGTGRVSANCVDCGSPRVSESLPLHTPVEDFQLVEPNAMTPSADAFKTQVGGGHYVRLNIQPVQFAMHNWWDFCAGSILKYLTRHRQKNGLQDLLKARHFVELRAVEILRNDSPETRVAITIDEYVEQNGIGHRDALALRELDAWVYEESDRSRLQLLVAIDLLIADYQ